MPFDAAPPHESPRRERVIMFAIPAPDLKAAIIAALFAGVLNGADVEALFAEYGLEHE